jgi:hypothetical protein
MADKKISALTSASLPLAGTEVLPIVQSGATVKVAVSDLTAGRGISATTITGSGQLTVTTTGVNTNTKLETTGTAGFNSIIFSDLNPSITHFGAIGCTATANKWFLGAGSSPNVLAPIVGLTWDKSAVVTMPGYGAGAATFSASGVISSVSDETWKIKDGVPTDTNAMLKKLQPGYWYYNTEKAPIYGFERQLGFYAQNVNAAIGPEAAPQPEEGKPWGYYDRSVLAIVVMSLQNALENIEVLTARITELEAK